MSVELLFLLLAYHAALHSVAVRVLGLKYDSFSTLEGSFVVWLRLFGVAGEELASAVRSA